MNIDKLDKEVFSKHDTPEHEAFLAKFKPKRTTDDCYTPPEIYDVVLKWVQARCPQIEGLRVVRPFYPGGDYTKEDYTDAVVIDNPPFSILAEIKRFYHYQKIPYFLFAPALTLFTSDAKGSNYIIANADITYANGANVRTGFISNLFGSKAIILAPDLMQAIDEVVRNRKKTNSLPTYVYPKNVISSALLNKHVNAGVVMEIDRSEVSFIRKLDSQEASGKAIFGAGFLVSDGVANRLEERFVKCKEPNASKTSEVEWALSDREKLIIKLLGTPEDSDELVLI
ncbi:chromosome partitioning protein ParB [uncultured Porphyromonas sp.]|uniref:chromosome partitioning protein ParB n=1 Tax=uncultured Porphyromonas sp. TaxID=159274 RepID=UPI002595A024|nr:chromosome partitioning protein ParB [uncultured Porphyromonas sp.]